LTRAFSKILAFSSHMARASSLWVSCSSCVRSCSCNSSTTSVVAVVEGGGEGLHTSNSDDQHRTRSKSNDHWCWLESYLFTAESQWEPPTVLIRRDSGDLLPLLEPLLQGRLSLLSSLAISSKDTGLASRSEVRKGVAAPTH
jgi:hypothetical protein